MQQQVIEVDGYVLFERASMPGQSSHSGALEDRACFMYMLNGVNMAIEPGGSTGIKATEGIIKKCGHYVSQFITDSPTAFCEGVAIYFHPEFIKKIYRYEIPRFLHVPNPQSYTRKVASNELIQQYIQTILPYFNSPELMDTEMATLKVKELVMLLLTSKNRSSVLDFFSELFASPKDLSFSEIIENNIFSSIQIEELAFLCNMSISTFKRTFKKQYQNAPATYIRQRRIDRAQQLLRSTDLQIQEIGYQCGFNEISSFSHTFLNVTGSSPSEFRLTQINK